MDGDHTAKTFEQGANSALKENEMSSGVHESVNQVPAAGDKTQGTGTSMFDKTGAVGKMFNADGAVGGTAQKVGGPFDKQGSVGQHFNADGKIGGMVQQNLAENKK
ncbi:MAG: hypothetical protein OHK93_003818 [Ramalina farinacea]|uniref:Uncharacterized protein n=1 Tax=Ramalina farinacea TaxID=258253 RepID=A0AA43QHV1_9LECA|nr:hypothetical protein [Ramalina farinacea]